MPRKKKWSKDEPPLPGFSFNDNVSAMMQQYKEVGEALNCMIESGPAGFEMEDEFELGQEIAIALKKELRASGISREEFVDRINEYLGRTEERYKEKLCRKPLSKPTLDKMISSPRDYPIDCYYLFAIQHVLGFGIINAILGAEGAQVVSGDDLRKIALLKAQEFRAKAQKLEKNIGRL